MRESHLARGYGNETSGRGESLALKSAVKLILHQVMIAEDSRCFIVETSPNVYGFFDVCLHLRYGVTKLTLSSLQISTFSSYLCCKPHHPS